MVRFRPMVNEDIPAAIALWQGLDGIGLREADSPVALARYLRRNPECSYIAESDCSAIVGVCLAGHDGRRGYLHHVAVAAAEHNRGIGRELVQRSLSALQAEGIEKVHLFVKVDNTQGLTFWKHLGWRERTDIVVMSLITGENPNA